MKTIMYLIVIMAIASVPRLYESDQQEKIPQAKIVAQEKSKTKVDSLIHIANTFEKKIDKSIMTKISNQNNEVDSLKRVIKRQAVVIKKYKKLLKEKEDK